jgi:hypothetical protein
MKAKLGKKVFMSLDWPKGGKKCLAEEGSNIFGHKYLKMFLALERSKVFLASGGLKLFLAKEEPKGFSAVEIPKNVMITFGPGWQIMDPFGLWST